MNWQSLFHVNFFQLYFIRICPVGLLYLTITKYFSYIPYSCYDLFSVCLKLFLGYF